MKEQMNQLINDINNKNQLAVENALADSLIQLYIQGGAVYDFFSGRTIGTIPINQSFDLLVAAINNKNIMLLNNLMQNNRLKNFLTSKFVFPIFNEDTKSFSIRKISMEETSQVISGFLNYWTAAEITELFKKWPELQELNDKGIYALGLLNFPNSESSILDALYDSMEKSTFSI